MAGLRRQLADLGLDEVETLINSGNVAFVDDTRRQASTIEKALEVHLRDWLGYDVATFLRTPKEVAAVAECAPFPELPPNGTVHVHFLKAMPSAQVQRDVI